MRALHELGILDPVLSGIHPEVPKPRPFRSLSGFGKHEFIYDVRDRMSLLQRVMPNL